MCTAMTLQSKQLENFFGRTMDFSYDIDPELYIVPKYYVWNNIFNLNKFYNCYSFIGIGQESDGMLGFFDGVNEKGFAAATLYFAGYSKYQTHLNHIYKEPISSLDFLHYILGRCGSVDELKEAILDIDIIGLEDPVTQSVAPLHWIATDKSGECVVIEQTEKDLKIFQNKIGIMSNSPDFQWHMTNLRNYMDVSPTQTSDAYWDDIHLKPFGQAGGTMQLPGGYTSPERFVRTAYQKTHIRTPINSLETINACFHIMESVTIPKGIVITDRDTYDYTKYTAFINTNTCQYFFKTYDNPQITSASLWDNYTNSVHPISLGKLKRPFKFEKIKHY
ncbi:choloylglycine hydrolase family protein [Clostridium sp. ZBS15]|uniref:linear amide C-N hydrolase n=1 Tax=Clostridium sp. ZBS15 TaxID=2949969 RepID=UPI00207A281F|nr:choloylglycine hydrolase family protein [Clostridium sp. ZBS15]